MSGPRRMRIKVGLEQLAPDNVYPDLQVPPALAEAKHRDCVVPMQEDKQLPCQRKLLL